jgi:5-methylcytosine-specific restriction endonuclease McrA
MCRASLAEKVIAERDIRDRKVNVLSSIYRRWKEALENPTGWIYGEWTVIGPAGEHAPKPPGEQGPLWRCRCICGAERDIPASTLTRTSISPSMLSCGCRPDAEVLDELRAKWRQAQTGFVQAMGRHRRRGRERQFDEKWTQAMQLALCCFQPACVLCATTDDLTVHHVKPLSGGHGLEPGNAVRLCRACNSFIYMRKIDELSPDQARRLETAAAQFKEHWESGCTTPASETVTQAEKTPKAPDPALIALLQAVECGDDTALHALADWMQELGDSRASAVREVARGEAVVRETRGGVNEESHWVEFRLDGKRCGSSALVTRFPGDTEESLAQRVQEARRRLRSNEVWRRLGLTESQRDTLKQYLGINPMGRTATTEEIAQQMRKSVQTIQNRIDLALHRLTVPNPQIVMKAHNRPDSGQRKAGET